MCWDFTINSCNLFLLRNTQDIIISYKLASINDIPYIVSFCADLKIKLWNLKNGEAVSESLQQNIKLNNTTNIGKN